MQSVCFISHISSNGVVERDFTLGEVTGVLWSPASGSEHVPLVLVGIPLTAIEPRITAAIFGGGFVVDESLIGTARRITVPVQFLLPATGCDPARWLAKARFNSFLRSAGRVR